jgi:hypothetical protein
VNLDLSTRDLTGKEFVPDTGIVLPDRAEIIPRSSGGIFKNFDNLKTASGGDLSVAAGGKSLARKNTE